MNDVDDGDGDGDVGGGVDDVHSMLLHRSLAAFSTNFPQNSILYDYSIYFIVVYNTIQCHIPENFSHVSILRFSLCNHSIYLSCKSSTDIMSSTNLM